jgi:hypothetical protein
MVGLIEEEKGTRHSGNMALTGEQSACRAPPLDRTGENC